MGSSRNGEALINNPSAQPGANIAPIDEIVRVSLGSLWLAVEGRAEERRGCLQRHREGEIDVVYFSILKLIHRVIAGISGKIKVLKINFSVMQGGFLPLCCRFVPSLLFVV